MLVAFPLTVSIILFIVAGAQLLGDRDVLPTTVPSLQPTGWTEDRSLGSRTLRNERFVAVSSLPAVEQPCPSIFVVVVVAHCRVLKHKFFDSTLIYPTFDVESIGDGPRVPRALT